ncbi:MAG TPA: tripartite tricarboxylate transporter permease [Stellaceae bacterium]|nr:tripartite tricarboxylate transporter permease [Stellaceae bacterium]
MGTTLHLLAHGFAVALTPENLIYCLVGAALGTLVGVLPGLSPVTTIAMLLPITFKIPAVASLIMLTGIYYGAHHAGSTTAIMMNMPGEPTSVVICLDGHPMAKQGRAGPALCIAALASFFAGCVGVAIIALFSPPLAAIAQSFGPVEYASMIVMALVAVSVITSEDAVTTISMAVLGLLLGTVGTDISTGLMRFTLGFHQLDDGLNFVAVAVGLFALAQITYNLGAKTTRVIAGKVTGLVPTRPDLKASWGPIWRGTALGSAVGIFPGTGPLIASFAAYSMERRLAKDPSRFGQGAIEGVAAPEASNNASTFTHFIPMLTLGIPAGAPMALMLAALMIQGITAGPQLMTQHADLFWGVIASMFIGNAMLLVLNLPLVGIWIRLLAVPYRFLYPLVLVCCSVGVYSVNNSTFDVLFAAGVSLIGFLFVRLGCSPAPLILGLILEPMLEDNFRRALLISRGDASVFVTRPISLGILIATAALLVVFCAPALRRKAMQGAAAEGID